jgi:NhaP-type Na+/H+ or K+/H+ antiporter
MIIGRRPRRVEGATDVDITDIAVIAGVVFLWGAFSAMFERLHLTAAMVFVAVGVLVSQLHGPLAGWRPSNELIKGLTELTLAVVLFTDAARIRFADFRADLGLYVRLLAVGLPLTIALGTGVAYGLFPSYGIWSALIIGAALAPTDAALGASVISNPVVPTRIRRLINVESGLNDGIATPFVMLALAGASSGSAHHDPGAALTELVVGVAIGVGIGGLGGEVLRWARRREWLGDDFAGPAVLSLALCAYATAVAVEGNGFIAAFVGGAAFGNLSGRENERLLPFVADVAGLASLIVWLLFGAIAVEPALERLSVAIPVSEVPPVSRPPLANVVDVTSPPVATE